MHCPKLWFLDEKKKSVTTKNDLPKQNNEFYEYIVWLICAGTEQRMRKRKVMKLSDFGW